MAEDSVLNKRGGGKTGGGISREFAVIVAELRETGNAPGRVGVGSALPGERAEVGVVADGHGVCEGRGGRRRRTERGTAFVRKRGHSFLRVCKRAVRCLGDDGGNDNLSNKEWRASRAIKRMRGHGLNMMEV